MTRITEEAKQSIIEKAINRSSKTLGQIAEENNVGYSTLTGWLKLTRQAAGVAPGRRGRPQKGQGHKPPLQHILATAGLDEEAIGAYCREQGIYNSQLKQWRNNLMNHNGNAIQSPKEKDELKLLKQEVKRLKKDLRRKDKALAETSALLVLKKKADLIWGEPAED